MRRIIFQIKIFTSWKSFSKSFTTLYIRKKKVLDNSWIYHSCGICMYSMTMSGTCATHVLTKANPKAVWSRRLRCMQVSLCWWSVNCCVQACKQTQRNTQGTERAKCAHVGDTNNTPPHAIRESGVIQISNRARVWQFWEAREDTWKYLSFKRPCKASDSFSSSRSRCTAECANSIFVPKECRFSNWHVMISAIGWAEYVSSKRVLVHCPEVPSDSSIGRVSVKKNSRLSSDFGNLIGSWASSSSVT